MPRARLAPSAGRSLATALAAACLALSGGCTESDAPPSPEVGFSAATSTGHSIRYWQVSETRVSRTEFEYEFAAEITSGSARDTELLARISTTDPTTVPTDAGLRFPAGAADTPATAIDTFAIRQDRRTPFDPSQLRIELLDRFGGDLEKKATSTGRFRMDVIDGRHWFITPDGHAFFSSALNNITWHGDYSPPIDRRPYHEAVLAKYGDEATWAEATEDRMRSWGLNTVGAWSNEQLWPTMPYTPVMSLNRAAPEVPGWPAGQTGQRIRDYFHPDFEANLPDRAGDVVICAADPYCVGVFSDNEMPWGRSVLQVGTYVDAYLTLPAGAPGKLELQAFFEERYAGDLGAFNAAWSLGLASFDDIQQMTELEPDAEFCNEEGRRADRQAFVARVASRYFEKVDAAIAAVSPDVLFLGTRFLAVYTAPAIYEAAAPFVDVISINDYDWDENGRGLFKSEGEPYGYLFLDDTVSDLETVHALTGKPMMITEWTIRTNRTDVPVLFPPFMPTADTQTERADRYEAFMNALIERPYMVGSHWFKFHDQPATGRGDGENSKFGVVDIEDTPYAELVERMAAVNARLYDPPSASPALASPGAAMAATVGAPLGTRRFSITAPQADRTGFYVFILPGTNLANGLGGDDLVIEAGAVDENGVAAIALAEDAIIGVEAVTGETACLDLRAVGSFGELACDGGFGHDVTVELGSGDRPLSGAVTETFLGSDAGPGAATLRVPLRFTQLPAGSTVDDCAAATATLEPVLAAFTTATVTSTKGETTFDTTGEPFACGLDGSGWRTEDGPGVLAVGVPLYDGRVPDGDLAASFVFADSEVSCRP